MAMVCAIAYLMVVVVRIPIIMFLSYEPKDVMITIGGFLFGPWASMIISIIVCLIEMITISDTGFIGFIMNALSSCCFACLAAWVYRKDRTFKKAALGLLLGILLSTVAMILWNYLLTPLYMGYPRKDVVAMLAPIILPFNLFKGGVNMAITLIIYKPIIAALQKSGMLPPSVSSSKHQTAGMVLTTFCVILTCILLYLAMTGNFL